MTTSEVVEHLGNNPQLGGTAQQCTLEPVHDPELQLDPQNAMIPDDGRSMVLSDDIGHEAAVHRWAGFAADIAMRSNL